MRSAAAVALALLLVGCTAPTAPPGSEAPSRRDLFLADGWSPAGAAYLASAAVEVETDEATRARVVQRWPDGIALETTLTLAPGASAGAERSFETREENGSLTFSWSYVVPYAELPSSAVDALRGGASSTMGLGALSPIGAARAQGGGDGVAVTGQATFNALASRVLSQGEATVYKDVGASVKGAPVTRALGAGESIYKAWTKLRPEHQAWMDRLQQARACAEDPANELTRKAYAEDPAYKERTVGEIDAAIVEVMTTTAVRFVGAEVSVASSATGWFALVVKPIAAWNDGELKAINEERVRDVERLTQGFCTCSAPPTGGGSGAADPTTEGGSGGTQGEGGGETVTLPPLECRQGLHLSYVGSSEGTFSLEHRDGDHSMTGTGSSSSEFRWSTVLPVGPGGGSDENVTVAFRMSSRVTITDVWPDHTTVTTWSCEDAVDVPFTVGLQRVPWQDGQELGFSPLAFPQGTCLYTRSDGVRTETPTLLSLVPHAGAGESGNAYSLGVDLEEGRDEAITHSGGGRVSFSDLAPQLYCPMLVGHSVLPGATTTCAWRGVLDVSWD